MASTFTPRVLFLTALYLCMAALAQAQPLTSSAEQGLDGPLLAALHDDVGWRMQRGIGGGGGGGDSGGGGGGGEVAVYRKDMGGTDLPGFRGELVVEVDSESLFELLVDLDQHAGLSDAIPLMLSQVLAQRADGVDYLQFLDAPAWTLTRDRYWFNRSVVERDLGGQVGRHRMSWMGIDPNLYPNRWRALLSQHPRAIRTPLNVGSWEVVPLGPRRCRLIYRVLSDPGGKLPRSLQVAVTAITLPENLLQFREAALPRAILGSSVSHR